MELIREAVTKARAMRQQAEVAPRGEGLGTPQAVAANRIPPSPRKDVPTWAPPIVTPDAKHLERNRIISFATEDPSHVAFNLLRTKVHKTLVDHAWRSLAITSPTGGCGKTMVAINLAFSLARQADCRTVLIDLDLKKSAISRTVGLTAKGSIGGYLQGTSPFEDCFLQIGSNLILGLNDRPIRNSAELMHHHGIRDMLQRVRDTLSPDVLLFDLPPMLASDDALAFLPRVDSALIVVGARTSTPQEVDQCETQVSGLTSLLGVVLNKVEHAPADYYYESE